MKRLPSEILANALFIVLQVICLFAILFVIGKLLWMYLKSIQPMTTNF